MIRSGVFFAAAFAAPVAAAAPRDVQIRRVDFGAGVVTLYNFSTEPIALGGYQLCTADEDEAFKYSSPSGLNGRVIQPHSEFHIHWGNNAPPGDPKRANRSELGGALAAPLDRGPYGLALYFPPVDLDNGASMADYVTWTDSPSNPGNASARARIAEAVSGAVWTGLKDAVVTSAATTRLMLLDYSGGALHDAADYQPSGPAPAREVDPLASLVPPGNIHIRLVPVTAGLTAPCAAAPSPTHPDRMFVADQTGVLWALDVRTGARTVFLDLSSRLVPLGVFGMLTYDERGLLGVAFHPDYAANGLLYTYTSEPASAPPDFSTMPAGVAPDHQSVIAEWRVASPLSTASTPSLASRREILRIDQPQFNQNGGAMHFGPDGRLYIGLGDGGGADDMDGLFFVGEITAGHGVGGNGQDLSNPLATILRIDPLGATSANGRYGVPTDNPFFNQAGVVAEIFAYGLRNPRHFAFDTTTGLLWAGDAGQNDIEEVNIVSSGGNYGWNTREGTFYFNDNGDLPGYVSIQPPPGAGAGPFVDPVAQYDHDDGIFIIGGDVYRGGKIPPLRGRFVFGDFARTFSSDGRLLHLNESNQVVEFNIAGQTGLGLALLGFGRDSAGELYVLANETGTPFGTTGVVLRIAPKNGDLNADGVVNAQDLGLFLGAWGTTNAAADINSNGVINAQDLGMLLGAWGD